ncbi:disks large homolog 5-like [Peromyscus eremicus]|uniref:disks large homolog 5-like n=1 Tax=Peromyscus eremicus TaxID=42410 RepID=UPI0027DBECD7|nr:disks large homolog 5-like [Peromyscus eremicus]
MTQRPWNDHRNQHLDATIFDFLLPLWGRTSVHIVRKDIGLKSTPRTGIKEAGASKEPPPTPTSLTKRQVKQKVKSLTTQLQVMTAQWNDLRDRLILVTEGSLDKRPYHRLNPFWENIKMEHQQVMSDLQNFKNENLEASQKLCELTKEKVFLWVGLLRHGVRGDQCRLAKSYYAEGISGDLQSRLLMEQSQLKKKLDMLRQEKENLLEDWVLLKHHLGDLRSTLYEN